MSNIVLANWNGEEMPLSEVRVSVLDRAFLFGDSVYEMIRVIEGRLFRFSDHLERLQSSLHKLSIKYNSIDALKKNVEKTLTNSGVLDGVMYIQITRGEAPRTHRYPENAKPNVLIYAASLADPYADKRKDGISVITYPDIRWGRNDIKQTALTGNCMAAQAAFEKGCSEAILIDSNNVMTEGTSTTIFGVKDGTILSMPESHKVLPSVTKKVVLELAHVEGIPVVDTWVKAENIFQLDEIFLASITAKIVPIVEVDGRKIATGKPGALFDQLYRAFTRTINVWLETEPSQNSAQTLIM